MRRFLAMLSVCLLAAGCAASETPSVAEVGASPSPVDTGEATASPTADTEDVAADGAGTAVEGADLLRTSICDALTCPEELVLVSCVERDDVAEVDGFAPVEQCPDVYAANTADGLVIQLTVIDVDDMVGAGWSVTLDAGAEGLYLDCRYSSQAPDDTTCASYEFSEEVDIATGATTGTQLREGRRAAMIVEFPGLRLDPGPDGLVLSDPAGTVERAFSDCTLRYGAGPAARGFQLVGGAACTLAAG